MASHSWTQASSVDTAKGDRPSQPMLANGQKLECGLKAHGSHLALVWAPGAPFLPYFLSLPHLPVSNWILDPHVIPSYKRPGPPKVSDFNPVLIGIWPVLGLGFPYPPVSREADHRTQVMGASIYWANIQWMFFVIIIIIIGSSIQIFRFDMWLF